MSDPVLREGAVAGDLAAEFPRLGLTWTEVAAAPRRSPPALRRRLHELATRTRGPTALVMRQAPVPQAYRVFFRHIGLDPDVDRPPGEAVVLDRLLRGGFASEGLVPDALTLALVETGVPLWAVDAAGLRGPLGLRLSRPGERAGRGEEATPVTAGRIVVADDAGPVAPLFGAVGPGLGPGRSTQRLALFAVRVAGVPAIHVEEAMWTCLEALATP